MQAAFAWNGRKGEALTDIGYRHGIRVLADNQRNNRLIVISPRLEEWLVASAKSAGTKMRDFGFESDSGRQLHGEINHRLKNVEKLVQALLQAENERMQWLQSQLK
jgi:two-component sensor histidine kinase